MTEPFRIGIAGLGTVGAGTVKVLQDNVALIEARAGTSIEIVCVSARSQSKGRGVDLSGYDWHENPLAIAEDDRVDCVVEMIGGSDGTAKELVEKALSAGKHVVTANKALLAHHGLELAQMAEQNGVCLNYEAAVAGGIPIIKVLREGLAANKMSCIYGILNGTCNYILSEMRETGRAFDDVLKEAQEKGYAEAEPSLDVDGIDAAHKLALLTALGFGVKPDFDALEITGIRHITIEDIRCAEALGYKIKLLGIARDLGDKITQSMEPCLVPFDSALGSVEGVFNAVFTEGDFVDKTMMEGRGAGAGPTASSVVADLIDLARGIHLPVFGVPVDKLTQAQWAGPDDLKAQHYLRLQVTDRPGVMADIAAILRDHDISIDALQQQEHDSGQPVSVVIVTHEIVESVLRRALEDIIALDFVLGTPASLRIERI